MFAEQSPAAAADQRTPAPSRRFTARPPMSLGPRMHGHTDRFLTKPGKPNLRKLMKAAWDLRV